MHRGISLLLIGLALASVAALQTLHDRASATTKEVTRQAVLKNETVLLPDNPTLLLLSGNQREIAADLLWLQTIQYFGTGNPYQLFPALGGYVDRVTYLDPHYSYPAQFALIGLPFMGQTETAVTIGERALAANPEDPLITFYLASTYHLHVKNYARAAELYKKASTMPGAPTASSLLASIAASQVNDQPTDRLAAIALWEQAYTSANSDDERDRAARWIAHLTTVFQLESAIAQYQKEYGSFPDSFTTIGASEPITTALEVPLDYNPETGKVGWKF